MKQAFKTPLTEILGIDHPVMLAGMNVAAGPDLAAAVSNAGKSLSLSLSLSISTHSHTRSFSLFHTMNISEGGVGTMGAIGWSVEFLKQQTDRLKSQLRDPDLPWGVDLLLPKVGEGARATNKDYTRGKLMLLVEAIIESGAKLFVSAVVRFRFCLLALRTCSY